MGKGEPLSKADVNIFLQSVNLLKLFNRELTPANAFMSGKLKVYWDIFFHISVVYLIFVIIYPGNWGLEQGNGSRSCCERSPRIRPMMNLEKDLAKA